MQTTFEVKGNVAVLMPRLGGSILMQEECCWSRNAISVPSLELDLTNYITNTHDTSAILMELGQPLDNYNTVAMVFSWAFGTELKPIVEGLALAGKKVILAANPPGCADDLRKVFNGAPVQVVTSTEVFGSFSFDTRADVAAAFQLPRRGIIVQWATGCPYRCPYCVWASAPKFRNIASARELLKRYIASPVYGHRQRIDLSLLGCAITSYPGWVRDFLKDELAGKCSFQADVNIRDATKSVLAEMHDLGLRRATIGVEFLTNSMLAKLNKGHTVAKALQVMGWLRDLHIGFSFSLRSGVGESVADLKELSRNLQAMHDQGIKPAKITFGPMVEWPGHGWLPPNEELVNTGTETFPRLAVRLSDEVKPAWAVVRDKCRGFGWFV